MVPTTFVHTNRTPIGRENPAIARMNDIRSSSPMTRPSLAASFLLVLVSSSYAETMRPWIDLQGRKFEASLVAADAVRATFRLADGRKTVTGIASLSADDSTFVREWRKSNRETPLIDPEAMPSWPAEVSAPSYEVRIIAEDRASGVTRYESTHFAIVSDIKLPLGVVRDLAAVFESTRAAVMAVPLALHSGIDRSPYQVRLFSNAVDYQSAGGAPGSGGYYNGRDMLILLPNLGIRPTTNGLNAEHQKQLFVLKHEVSHQVVGRWTMAGPTWLSEGIAELFAAAPYVRGKYTFQNLESALQAYVLKWRTRRDSRSLRLIAPAKLMTMSLQEWQGQVATQSAYDLYNSAALLVYWFARYDGRGDGAGLAGYFDALYRRVPAEEAERTHLLRGRNHEQLAAEVRKLAKKMALSIDME
jgi:hypothetical protein